MLLAQPTISLQTGLQTAPFFVIDAGEKRGYVREAKSGWYIRALGEPATG
jgi:hypothetical protein